MAVKTPCGPAAGVPGPRTPYASRMRPRSPALGLLAAALLSCGAPTAPPVRNLVLITVDTLRADHVGAYGGVGLTPVLNELARQGVVVEGACTPTPSTGPAHASLLSGLHPWRHGVLGNLVPLAEAELELLAPRARQAGLRTAAFVSSYVLHPRYGFAHGFEHYHFEPSQPGFWGTQTVAFSMRGEDTSRAAIRWIEEFRAERFLVWIHYFEPHAPYEPPPRFLDLVPRETELPEAARAAWRGDGERLAELQRAYRGEVAYVDAQIGRVVDALQTLGLWETTALVVTADHGEGLGDHGLLGHGQDLFDEAILVPLIVRAPSIPAGRRVRGPAQLEDLMPSMLSLLGLPAPQGIDGVDLLPWWRGEVEHSPRRAVLGRRGRFESQPDLFFERRWPHKWIGELAGGGTPYRLDEDPGESAGGTAAPTPAALHETAGRASTPARERTLDAESRRALEALGYLDGP